MSSASGPIRLRPALLEPLADLERGGLVLVSAPGGYGKTTLLGEWCDHLRAEGRLVARLGLAPLHADPGLFVEDFVEAVREALGERASEESTDERFGAALLRRLAVLATGLAPAGAGDGGEGGSGEGGSGGQGEARDDLLEAAGRSDASGDAGGSASARTERIARHLLRSIRDLGEPLTLLLDDVHLLPRGRVAEGLVDALVAAADGAGLRVVIASRGQVPRSVVRRVAEGRVAEVGAADLSLRADQVADLVDRRIGSAEAADDELVPLVVARTGGWAMGVLLAIRALARRPGGDPRVVLAALGHDDALFGPLAQDLLGHERAETLEALELAALLGPVDLETAREAIGRGPACETALRELVDKGYATRAGGTLAIHALWQEVVLARLRGAEERERTAARVRRCTALLERGGWAVQAAELCLAFGLEAELIGLLERHGLDWVERGQRAGVARWLAAVRGAVPERPELELLWGVLEAHADPVAALASLDRAAARFHHERRPDRELAALHNMLIVAGNAGRRDETRSAVLRLLSLRRLLSSSEARGIALLFGALAAFQRGRHRIARGLIRRASGHAFGPRERGALAMGQVQFAYLAGALREGLATADAALADLAQRRHGPSFYTLRALRAFGRGALDLDRAQAIAQLRSAREAVRELRMELTEAECALWLARLLLVDGRAAEAVVEAEHAVALYARVDNEDGQTGGRALVAHASWLAGDPEGARRSATAALAAFEGARRSAPLRFRSHLTPLAARVLAELGERGAADRFARRWGRVFEPDDVALCQYTAELALGRVAAMAGDARRAHRHLERAARAEARLDAPGPELDPALLDWARAERVAAGGREPAAPAGRPVALPPRLRIDTLGGLEVWLEGRPVAPERWRGQTTRRLLLRLLCAEGRPIERERLATELWPDAEPARARGNLRVGLSRLRRVFEPEREAGEPEPWLELGGPGIALSARTLACWDVFQARSRIEAARRARREGAHEHSRSLLLEAVSLHRGPFAPDAYDDWVIEARHRWQEALLVAGREGAEAVLTSRPDEACALAERLVALEPGDEPAWLLLIRGWLERGDRTAALRAAQRAEEALRRTLDLAASPALRSLVETIRRPAS